MLSRPSSALLRLRYKRPRPGQHRSLRIESLIPPRRHYHFVFFTQWPIRPTVKSVATDVVRRLQYLLKPYGWAQWHAPVTWCETKPPVPILITYILLHLVTHRIGMHHPLKNGFSPSRQMLCCRLFRTAVALSATGNMWSSLALKRLQRLILVYERISSGRWFAL